VKRTFLAVQLSFEDRELMPQRRSALSQDLTDNVLNLMAADLAGAAQLCAQGAAGPNRRFLLESRIEGMIERHAS